MDTQEARDSLLEERERGGGHCSPQREEVKDIKGESRSLKLCNFHPNFRKSMAIRQSWLG